MDVRLSAEQQALRDAAAQVVDRLGAQAVGQLDDLERAAKLDAAVVASGWRELRCAAQDLGAAAAEDARSGAGGEAGAASGDAAAPLASGVEAAIVAEELGRGLADVAFLGPTLAAELRRLAGAPGGPPNETVGFTADLGGLVAADDGLLPGRVLAPDVSGPAPALALVADGASHTLATVEVVPNPEQVDLTRPLGAPAGASAIPVEGGSRVLDEADLARFTALGLALTCADLVGVMRGAIDLTVDYAAQRRQFGVPVGSFQAVQHMLADATVAMEGARSATLHAAWAVDALDPTEALAAGAVAKAWSARAARQVCETAVQVHAGIGNTWECLAHVFMRRALLSTDLFGGVGPNLERVLAAQGLGREPARQPARATVGEKGADDGLR